jgi:protocatechuate 3,4-dioxygenase beta subunit
LSGAVPLRDATVTLRGAIEHSIQTNENGEYTFTQLGPGRYQVAVQPSKRPELLEITSQEVVVESALSFCMVDFAAFVDARIKGRVVDKEGRGVAKVLVELMPTVAHYRSTAVAPTSASTDADGHYEFSKLPPGRYIVRVDIRFMRSPSSKARYATPEGASRGFELNNGQHVQLSPIVLVPPQ